MEIVVKVKNVYGRFLAYPVNGKAITAAAMVGRTTLTRADLACLIALGFTIAVADGKFSQSTELALID